MVSEYYAHLIGAAHCGFEVVVTTSPCREGGHVIVTYPVAERVEVRDVLSFLAEKGWKAGRFAEPGERYPVAVAITATADIVVALTAARTAAAEYARRCDVAWRIVIANLARDGGRSVSDLAADAGVSRSRVYQIRDNRR